MIKKLVLNCSWPALLVLFFSCELGNEVDVTPADVFVKYYGGVGEHRVSDILVDQRGEIVLFGTQRLALAEASQTLYLVKTDSTGNQLMTSTIDPGTDEYLDSLVSINSTVVKPYENGYIISGNAAFTDGNNFSNSFIFWSILDQDMQPVADQWDTISSLGLGSQVNMEVSDMFVSDDGIVTLGGYTEYPQSNDLYQAGQRQNFITRFSPAQDSVYWRRSDGRPNFRDEVVRLVELSDNRIAAIGLTNRAGSEGEGGINVSYLLYNREGLSQVATSFRVGMTINGNDAADDIPADILQTGDVVRVIGTSSVGNVTRMFVMIFQGGQVQKQIVAPSNEEENITGESMTFTRTGDLILAGSNLTVQNGDIYVVKTNSSGQLKEGINENTYGIPSGNDVAKASVTLPNGSVLIASDVDFGSGQIMMGLMKINDRVELQRQ